MFSIRTNWPGEKFQYIESIGDGHTSWTMDQFKAKRLTKPEWGKFLHYGAVYTIFPALDDVSLEMEMYRKSRKNA